MSRKRRLGENSEEAEASLPGEGDVPGCWSDPGRARLPVGAAIQADVLGGAARAGAGNGADGQRGATVSSAP